MLTPIDLNEEEQPYRKCRRVRRRRRSRETHSLYIYVEEYKILASQKIQWAYLCYLWRRHWITTERLQHKRQTVQWLRKHYPICMAVNTRAPDGTGPLITEPCEAQEEESLLLCAEHSQLLAQYAGAPLTFACVALLPAQGVYYFAGKHVRASRTVCWQHRETLKQQGFHPDWIGTLQTLLDSQSCVAYDALGPPLRSVYLGSIVVKRYLCQDGDITYPAMCVVSIVSSCNRRGFGHLLYSFAYSLLHYGMRDRSRGYMFAQCLPSASQFWDKYMVSSPKAAHMNYLHCLYSMQNMYPDCLPHGQEISPFHM